MGQLVIYLQGLRSRDVIDPNIVYMLRHPHPLIIRHGNWVHTRVQNYNYNFTYVQWVQGAISYGEVYANQDILSLPFSGCYMARIGGIGNTYYCYHIHKGTDGAYKDQKYNWNAYIRHLQFLYGQNNIILYKPNTHLVEVFRGIEYWGIISDVGECFTVVVEKQTNPIRYIFRAITKEPKCFRLTIP